MNKFYILILISQVMAAQTLPKKDKGLALSFNYCHRYLNEPTSSLEKVFLYPTMDYKCNYNFKNKISIKTGASLFFAAHTFTYISSYYYSSNGYYSSKSTQVEKMAVYGYIRIPLLFSYNLHNLYIDIGAAPCLRIFHSGQEGRGNHDRGLGGTYTLESHIGYYLPLKQRRLFIEGAIYFSEINSAIETSKGYYLSGEITKYSQNFQLSIGMMFNKNKALAKTTE